MAGVEINAPLHRDGRPHTDRLAHGGAGQAPAAPQCGASHRGHSMNVVERVGPSTGGGGAAAEPGQGARPTGRTAGTPSFPDLARRANLHDRDVAAASGIAISTIRGRGNTPGAVAQRGGQAMAARNARANAAAASEEGAIRGRGIALGGLGTEQNGGGAEASEQRPTALAEMEATPKRNPCDIEGDRPTVSQRMAALRQRIATRGDACSPASCAEVDRGPRGAPAQVRHGQIGGVGAEESEDTRAAHGGGDTAGTSPYEEVVEAGSPRIAPPHRRPAPVEPEAVAPARQLKTLKFTTPPAGVAALCIKAGGEVADSLRGQPTVGPSADEA